MKMKTYRTSKRVFSIVMLSTVFLSLLVFPGETFGMTRVVSVKSSSKSVGRYERLTVHVTLSTDYENPFDPNQILVDAIIKSPSGEEIVQPCFFYEGPQEDSSWQMRFTPMEVGKYSYQIKVVKGSEKLSSENFKIDVSESGKDGFLRIDPESYYAFKFDSGRLWRGIGINQCWESHFPHYKQNYTYDYMFGELEKYQGNFVRTWMCPWNLHLEWNRWWHDSKEAGKYDLVIAQRLDEVVELAEQKGIYLMICFDFPSSLRDVKGEYGLNDDWKNNPYNAANGGPCEKPLEFFTKDKAKVLYKRRLRYIVARWGYSPNIVIWEFWNGIDDIWRGWNKRNPQESVEDKLLLDWHSEMGRYLKGIDPYDHLITTSRGAEQFESFWELDEMDFSQYHWYADTKKLPGWINEMVKKYNKPHVIGETGYDWHGPHWQGQAKYYTMELHLALWRGMFSQTPVLPVTWWWEFHEHNGDFTHIKAAVEFNKAMLKSNKPLEDMTTKASEGLDSMGLKAGKDMCVWIINGLYGSDNVKKHGMPKPVENGTVSIPDVAKGKYTIRFYDTYKGAWLSEEQAEVSQDKGVLEIKLPKLEKDLACMISLGE